MISIAMATYNGQQFIEDQLESIISQTYQNFELIICDDNSTDSTFSILENYAKKDKRIKLYKNEVNLGFKLNFEKVISLCVGDYIALCDQDDVWEKDHLKILYKNIGQQMVACGNANIIDSQNQHTGWTLSEMKSLRNTGKAFDRLFMIMYWGNPFQGASMLLSKPFVEIALPIPSGINYHDTWFSALASYMGNIVYTDMIVNNYRFHDHNVTHARLRRSSKVKSIINHIISSDSIFDRQIIINALDERSEQKTEEQKRFIAESRKFIKRHRSLIGRLMNLGYLFTNYNKIYCRR